MSNIRVICLMLSGILVYQGYLQRSNPTTPDGPNPSVVIDTAQDSLPEAPTGSVLSSSEPIVAILKGNSDDAIKLARAFKGWSELLGRSTKIKTTSDFNKVFIDANRILFEKHGIVNKYQGKLDNAFNATILASFQEKGLTEGNLVKSVPWDNNSQGCATRALDAISYQCYQAFLAENK